jgi:hypothetical protein
MKIKVNRPHEPCPACEVVTTDDDALACCVGCRRPFHATCFAEQGCALCQVAPTDPLPEPPAPAPAPEPSHAPREHKIPAGEKPQWLDRPSSVRLLAYGVGVACLLFFIPELLAAAGVYHKHPSVGIEVDANFGFYPVYGFVAYSAVVVLGEVLKKAVQRKEGYYDE